MPGASLGYDVRPLPVFWGPRGEAGCLVLDLGCGGVRFLAMKRVRPGARIRLDLLLSEGEPSLPLRGRVAWCSRVSGGAYQVGVELAPYGEAAGDNPRGALERLRELEARLSPA